MVVCECCGSVKFDILLKGGHVIDAKNGLSAVRDVAIADGKVAVVDVDIPPETAKQVFNVGGLVVTPGLIDIHVHCHPYSEWFGGCIQPDAQSWRTGVTTYVDAGTSGPLDFGRFKERTIDRSRTRIFAFINIADHGMGPGEQERDHLKPELTAAVCKAFPKDVVGVKAAHYWGRAPWDEKHQPWDNVGRAVQAGELCQMPVMIDFWPRPPERSYEELILKQMRPGDIHTHNYAQQHPVIMADGSVNPALFQARKRGVIFDVGHGGGSFWFRNGVRAMQQGFPPDSLSTDLHCGNTANGLVTSVMDVASKFMAMGMSLDDVIYRSTWTPAQEINHSELGHLSVGAPADVAVFNVRKGEFGFWDCGGAKILGDKKLEAILTFQGGQLCYDANGMNKPLWQDAPPAYWICP